MTRPGHSPGSGAPLGGDPASPTPQAPTQHTIAGHILAARLSHVDMLTDRMTQATSRLKPTSDIPPLERQFHAAMIRLCDQARSRARFPLHGLRALINAKGGLTSARRLLAEPRVSDSFADLARRGFLAVTVETLVLRPQFASLFTDDEKAIARDRLANAGPKA